MDYTEISQPLDKLTLSRETNSSIDKLLDGQTIDSSELTGILGGMGIVPESLTDGILTSKLTIGGGTDALKVTFGSDILLKEGGDIKFTSVTAPGACVGTLAGDGAGNVDDGAHIYKVTFVTDTGETELGTASNTVTVVDKTSDGKVSLTAIPTSSSVAVTSRKIYRTKAGGSTYFLLTTLNDTTTITYTDNTADASLGINGTNRENNTFGTFEIDGVNCGSFGVKNIFLGKYAGEDMTTGHTNVFVGGRAGEHNTTGYQNTHMGYAAGHVTTTGYTNTFIGNAAGYENIDGYSNAYLGVSAGYDNTSGYQNTFIGAWAGENNTDGYFNVFLGYQAGDTNTTGDGNIFLGGQAGGSNAGGSGNVAVGHTAGLTNSSGNASVFLGYQAGYYETAGSKLFIDNAQRSNEADGRVKALIYGVFDADPANQSVTINGDFTATGTITGAGLNLTIASDNLKQSDDTEDTWNAAAWEASIWGLDISSEAGGLVRVKWQAKRNSGSGIGYMRVYVNDVAVGAIKSTTSASFESFTEDNLYVASGDEVQLYTYSSDGGLSQFSCKEFRIYWDVNTKGYIDTNLRIFKNGTATYDMTTASGTQTIAHGLGIAPKIVRLTGIFRAGTANQCLSNGCYNGTTNSCVYLYDDGSNRGDGNSDTNGIYFSIDNSNKQEGVITVDATNITITWTKTSSPSGTFHILWETEG